MDHGTILGLSAGGGTILLVLLGWGLKVGSRYIWILNNEKVRRLIYDMVKGQVRTTMPDVIKGPGKGGISKEVAKKRVINAVLGLLGPLAGEFRKMSNADKEALIHGAVHSVKKEGMA